MLNVINDAYAGCSTSQKTEDLYTRKYAHHIEISKHAEQGIFDFKITVPKAIENEELVGIAVTREAKTTFTFPLALFEEERSFTAWFSVDSSLLENTDLKSVYGDDCGFTISIKLTNIDN